MSARENGAGSHAMAETAAPPLRVGVVLGSGAQPRWVGDLLRDVASSAAGTLALVVRAAPAAHDSLNGDGGDGGLLRRLADASRHWLFHLYSSIDRIAFPVDPDPLEPVSVEPLLAGCPALTVGAAGSADGSVALTAADAAAIRAYALDVLVALTPLEAPRGLPDVARYGIWSYRHGSRGGANGAAGVDEVLAGNPVTPAALRVTSWERGATRLVSATYARTEKFSVNRNRAYCYRKAVALVGRKLRDVHELGEAALDGPPLATDAPAAPPTNGETLRALTRVTRSYVSRRLQRGGAPGDWFIAYQIGPSLDGADISRSTFDRFTPLRAPAGRFWADPFPAVWEGRYYVFVEDFVHATQKGHIAVLDVTPGSESRDAVPVLDLPHHLSYPFVFRWRGEHFMIPESVHDAGVDLYRATRFPFEWEHHARLLDGVRAVDATLVEADGRWWMFTNIGQPCATAWSDWNEELHLFHAPTPLGPWTPHPRNPVKSDVRSSRPAGKLFRLGDALYRPSQDCSERYGYAITVSRVDRLDTEAFHEVEVARIAPRWSPELVGTHTLNHADGLTVIDGRERQRWPVESLRRSRRAPRGATRRGA
ncbi:MAG TPA: hypothetical protein VFJ74_09980 [Gemmatimonadaceae bacterium]|nr:hypothetical protein [Gemmatimonadaceae bacterium]